MNHVTIMGRLVRDPDIRTTQDGTMVAKFTVACDRKNKKKLQEMGRPTADFISCIAWKKTAEIIGNHFTKGSRINVAGHIQTGSYNKQDGTKVYTTDVVVEEFDFIDYDTGSSTDNNAFGNNGGNISDEEIPF